MRLLLTAALAILSAAPGLPAQEGSPAERLLDLLEKRHRETPDPSDVRLAATRLGFDRAKILAFVAGLGWEPYVGILRDASGTLLCGAGNSVDRALLLQALLEAGGEKTRLMRVDLAEADGARLLDSFRKREIKPRPDVDPKVLAQDLGVDAPALETLVAGRRKEESDLVDEILEAAKAEAGRVAPLVGAIAGRAAAAPKEHVWVQVSDKAAWVDLDPSPVEISHEKARPLLPAELAAQRRTVTFRLVMYKKTAGKSEPVVLLNVPAPLASVSWKPVDLLLTPLRGQIPHSGRLRDLDDKARVEAFRQAKKFRGGLIVDGKYFGGIPFDLSGNVYEVDAGGAVGTAKAMSGGVGKAFGGLGGGLGGGGGDEAPASTIESLALEVGVKEPGAAEVLHKRTLYAPAKAGDRANPLPILRYSFLVDGAPLPAGERGRREVATYARNVPALRKLFKGEFEGVHFSQTADVSSLLLRFGDLRRRALARLGEGANWLQDRPGVFAETSQVFVEEGTGKLILRRGLDIMDNPVRFETGDKTLAFGLAETVLECLLVARKWPGGSSLSAWSSMERARLQGGKVEVVDRDGRREIRWSPAAGWSIDPASGSCVGRVASGAGQGMVEKAWEEANEICTYSDVAGLAAGSLSATGTKSFDDAADYFGKACGVVGGTWARDKAADQIKSLQEGLWAGTLSALSGM